MPPIWHAKRITKPKIASNGPQNERRKEFSYLQIWNLFDLRFISSNPSVLSDLSRQAQQFQGSIEKFICSKLIFDNHDVLNSFNFGTLVFFPTFSIGICGLTLFCGVTFFESAPWFVKYLVHLFDSCNNMCNTVCVYVSMMSKSIQYK